MRAPTNRQNRKKRCTQKDKGASFCDCLGRWDPGHGVPLADILVFTHDIAGAVPRQGAVQAMLQRLPGQAEEAGERQTSTAAQHKRALYSILHFPFCIWTHEPSGPVANRSIKR